MIDMANFPIAGASVRVSYGWETTFGTLSGSINKAFSQGVKVTTFEIDNTVEYLYGLGSQDVQRSVAKEFKGTWGIEFPLSDPWWLKSILGASPAKTGAGPYTYTYNSTNGISNSLASATIDLSFDFDTDSHQQLLGCVSNTMGMTCNVGEVVKVRLDGLFANLVKDTSGAALIDPAEEPFSFARGSFEIPTATVIADVQTLEMTFNRNVEFVWGLGNRIAQRNVPKQREWIIRLTATYENDNQFWDKLLGSATGPTPAPAEIATAKLTISNAGATTDERSYTFSFTNVRVERGSIPAAVEDVVKQDITLRARTLDSVVVVNNTSVEP